MTVAMELAAALHHSRGVEPSPHAAIDAATQTYAAPAPVDEYIAPPPAVHFAPAHADGAVPAPVNEYAAPAPDFALALFQEPACADRPGRAGSSGAAHRKIVEIPGIQPGQGTQTSTSLGTTPSRRVTLAETLDRVEVWSPLPAEPVSPMCVTTPVVEAPVVMVEHVLLAPSWSSLSQEQHRLPCPRLLLQHPS